MGRPRAEHPRNVSITVRVTEAGGAKIDDLRGSWTRSEWARRAVADAANRPEPLRGPK